MSVDHSQEEEVALPQILFNAANDHRAIRIAYLLSDDTNSVGPHYA